MPFFKRKSANEKQKSGRPIQPSPDPGRRIGSVKRTPSNRSATSVGHTDPNGDLGVAMGTRPRPPKLLLTPEDLQDTTDFGDCGTSIHSHMRTFSRLSKSMSEILHDKDALSCFIKYMDAMKTARLIRFWLDAESFQASTWSRLRSHSLNTSKKSSSIDKAMNDIQVTSPNLESRTAQDVLHNENVNGNVPTQDSVYLQSFNTSQPSTDSIGSSEDLSLSVDAANEVFSHQEPAIGQEVPQLNALSKHNNIAKHGAVIEGVGTDALGPNTSTPESQGEGCDGEGHGASAVISGSTSQEGGERKMKRGVSQEDLADRLKKSIERDAVKIFTKYVSHDATDPIGATDELRNETIHKICREDGQVDPQCFLACQEFAFTRMENEFHEDFLVSEYHYMHQINTLTSTQVHLADVLYNDGALFYFTEYLEQEGGSHFLQFLVVTDNFQQHLASCEGQYDGMEAQRDAMVLYDKFFSLQATDPLGFDDKIRFEVEENICREAGPLPHCFGKPRDVVLRTIDKTYFPSYLQSDIYYKYLSELVSTVETANYPPRHRKRAGSDASSEHSSHSTGSESRSSKNTYLATDTSHLRHTPAMSKLDSAMNLDPGLLNPDLLWKRTSPKMTLGKVDTLGEFVSEFDPNPDQEKTKSSSIFKRKKTKEKEQEDMALKIAQMIINDVTSVTQTIGALKNTQSDLDDGS